MKQVYFYFCIIVALSVTLIVGQRQEYKKLNKAASNKQTNVSIFNEGGQTSLYLEEGNQVRVSILNGEVLIDPIQPIYESDVTLGDSQYMNDLLGEHIPLIRPNDKKDKVGIYMSVASDFNSEINIYFSNLNRIDGYGEVYFILDLKYFPLLKATLEDRVLLSKKDLFDLILDVLNDSSIENVELVHPR